MKIFLLLPNLILFTISYFNLSEPVAHGQQQNIVVTLLHVFVMLICVAFTTLIVRSMFTVKSIELEEERQNNTAQQQQVTA